MRLDIYLVEKNIIKSRERAKDAIKSGHVIVNGIVQSKPSFDVNDDNVVFTGEQLKYVGRGGLKLEHAIEKWHIDLHEMICLDIGASTGGFTDCMLQNGAKLVYAVDVGHDQLDEKLLSDKRVINVERTNVKNITCSTLSHEIDFIATDVSFVSLTQILPKIKELLPVNKNAVVLIKPQFEAGKSDIGKNGIVKNPKVHLRVLKDIADFCYEIGLEIYDMDFPSICGGDGNIEYLAYLTNNSNINLNKSFDFADIVSKAFSTLKTSKFMKGDITYESCFVP